MITIISPAKSLNFDIEVPDMKTTLPHFLNDAEKLVKVLKKKKPAEVQKMMDISFDLASLNYQRYQSWSVQSFELEAKPAVLVFSGEVYRGLEASKLNPKQLEYAQQHLVILSGLYGALRALDNMLPYRLEMGTPLATNAKTKNLYAYWGGRVTEYLNELSKGKPLINLASNEYFKVVKPKLYKGEIATPVFKEFKNGKHVTVMTYAKQARGKMTRYIIENKIEMPEKLKAFNTDGYMYTESLSTDTEWVFTR
ncbi:MAG: peroxide stress protein YaaA [Flavobacteriales bacterium]